MVAELQEQIQQAKGLGIDMIAAEVGPDTWEKIIAWMIVPKPPKAEMIKEFRFMGVRIRKNDEVPEGRIWPLL